MPQLDPSSYTSQLFWLAICMAVLYVALARIVLPPLMRAMERRDATRADDLARAQALKDEADRARQVYEQALADARIRAQALFAEAEETHRKKADAAAAELARTLAAQTAEAEKKLAATRDALLKDLLPTCSEFASLVAEKLSGKRPDAARAAAAVQRATTQH